MSKIKLTREFTIKNQFGIHARPAALFVKLASRYDSELIIEKDNNKVSGKSIMGLLTIEASFGSKLKVTAEGHDAKELLDELEALVDSKFEEE